MQELVHITVASRRSRQCHLGIKIMLIIPFAQRLVIFTLICIQFCSCEKFVAIDPPATELVSATVFAGDATAIAALSNIYAKMAESGYASGDISSLSYLSSLSADELDLYSNTQTTKEFYLNTITPGNSTLNNRIWQAAYEQIYKANALLESLSISSGVSNSVKEQLQGEAFFLRAFSYFYLVNLFGDIPLALTTDYQTNANMPRSPIVDVYSRIINDLTSAQQLLNSTYSVSAHERVRPNKYAAKALLARVLLYNKNWETAESLSTEVIENSLYELESLDKVFLKNSKEAILQLIRDNRNSNDAITFIITASSPSNSALKRSIVNNFDVNDQRRENWIGTRVSGVNTYYYPNKYKVTALTPVTEYSMVLRLSEQYLIRAEARIQQEGKLGLGIGDLNIIRERASLLPPNNMEPLPPTLTRSQAMDALEVERQHELFTEWGHRWLDLKRWPSKLNPGDKTLSRADDVLTPIKPSWRREWQLYPIPLVQILNDPAMANAQNPGYD